MTNLPIDRNPPPSINEPSTETPHWLTQALTNPAITDLCLNGSRSAFVDQGLGLEKLEIDSGFNEFKLREWVIGQLGLAGKPGTQNTRLSTALYPAVIDST